MHLPLKGHLAGNGLECEGKVKQSHFSRINKVATPVGQTCNTTTKKKRSLGPKLHNRAVVQDERKQP